MPDPRFRPSRVVANPRHFGRLEHPELRPDSGMAPVERARALLQHRAAFVALQALSVAGMSVDDLAAAVGEQPDWLVRKLHGQVPAGVEDFVAWAAVLGVDVWPVLVAGDLV